MLALAYIHVQLHPSPSANDAAMAPVTGLTGRGILHALHRYGSGMAEKPNERAARR